MAVRRPRLVAGAAARHFPKISRYWNGSGVVRLISRSFAAFASLITSASSTRSSSRRAGAEAVLAKVHDADAAGWPQRLAHDLQPLDRLQELTVDADDQYRVDRIGQLRIVLRAEHHGHVGEPLAPDAPLHRLDHGLLDVLGVDAAVRADAAGEAHREPAAAGAQVGDARAFVDAERIHDQRRAAASARDPGPSSSPSVSGGNCREWRRSCARVRPGKATSAARAVRHDRRVGDISSPGWKFRCIRRAMHPVARRCSSFEYRPYSRSSRLDRRAPHPSPCDAALPPRAARPSWPRQGPRVNRGKARCGKARSGLAGRSPCRHRRAPAPSRALRRDRAA